MDLPALRTRLGLTQAELADRLGVSKGHMGDLERGHRKLTVPLAAKLEEISGDQGIIEAVVAERIGSAA